MNLKEMEDEAAELEEELQFIDEQLMEREEWAVRATHARRIKFKQLHKIYSAIKGAKEKKRRELHLKDREASGEVLRAILKKRMTKEDYRQLMVEVEEVYNEQ
jgi:Iap family predicted aminopeptidase